MATKRLLSTQVKVFPTAYRGKTTGNKVLDPESRLNTEKNLTRIATKITSHDSFVVNRDFDLASGESEKLEVCLKGYLFELDLSYSDLSTFTSDGKVYAEVKVEAKNPSYAEDTTNTEYEGLSLSPLDNGQTVLDSGINFIGLELSSSIESGEDKFLILEYKNSKWVVPSTSTLRLDTRVIEDGFGVDSIGKSIKEELHTGDVWIDNEKEGTNSGLIVNTSGKIIKNNFTTSDPTASGNSYSYIDSISQNKIGKITATKKTIPDAGTTVKGLVTTEPQSFAGIKYFRDGIEADSIISTHQDGTSITSASDLNITSISGDIKIETEDEDHGGGDIDLITHGNAGVFYNNEEVATIDYMEDSGISSKAKKLGTSSINYSVGDTKTPVYFLNGEPYETRFSMVGLNSSPANAWIDISTTNPSFTDSNSPGTFSYSTSNELKITNAYLCGISDDKNDPPVQGAATLSLIIQHHSSDSFNFINNKWLHINILTFINNYFNGYYFSATGGIVQEENLSFLATGGTSVQTPGNRFWLLTAGSNIYIGARGDGEGSNHRLYQLNIVLYGRLSKNS